MKITPKEIEMYKLYNDQPNELRHKGALNVILHSNAHTHWSGCHENKAKKCTSYWNADPLFQLVLLGTV